MAVPITSFHMVHYPESSADFCQGTLQINWTKQRSVDNLSTCVLEHLLKNDAPVALFTLILYSLGLLDFISREKGCALKGGGRADIACEAVAMRLR